MKNLKKRPSRVYLTYASAGRKNECLTWSNLVMAALLHEREAMSVRDIADSLVKGLKIESSAIYGAVQSALYTLLRAKLVSRGTDLKAARSESRRKAVFAYTLTRSGTNYAAEVTERELEKPVNLSDSRLLI